MAAKKVSSTPRVQLSRKPTDTGYKKELIRKTMPWPVDEVIAYAKENGVVLKKTYVHTTRWSIKKGAKPKRKYAKGLKNNAPVTTLVKATPAAIVRSGKHAVPAQDGSNHVSEKAMALLIMKLGTIRARELIDRTEATFHKNLGI
jgi:hypothetical protein